MSDCSFLFSLHLNHSDLDVDLERHNILLVLVLLLLRFLAKHVSIGAPIHSIVLKRETKTILQTYSTDPKKS